MVEKADSRVGVPLVFAQPHIVPLISLADPRSWVHQYAEVNSLIVPFYETWDNNEISLIVGHQDIHDYLDFDGPIGLSSIGPDDYVTSEAYFSDFVRFSTEANFDFVIAWDMPTYADWPPAISRKNMLHGLEQVRRLIRQGIEVIGLLNGSNRSNFEECADSLQSMGVGSVAIHASDYLRRRKDGLLMALMQDALKTASSKFCRMLIIGAMDPYLIKYEIRDNFPNASISGFSWFIDAKHGLVYSAGGRINTNQTDVLCNCSHCIRQEAGALSRSTLDRGLHNFLVVHNAVNGESFPNLETFDIVHRGEKIMIMSGLGLGTKESLILDFCDVMRKEKPKVLVLLGDTFNFPNCDPYFLDEHAKSFFRLLSEIACEVYPIFGAKDSSLEVISECLKRTTYAHEINPNVRFSRYLIQEPDRYFYYLYKFYVIARRSISIRLAEGNTMYGANGPLLSPKFPSSGRILEDLTSEQVEGMLRLNRCDRLVLGGYYKKIIREGILYSLGGWQAQSEEQERLGLIPDLKGALIIESEGITYKEF